MALPASNQTSGSLLNSSSARLALLRHTSRAVSKENVRIVWLVMDAINRRDVDELLNFMAPTVEFVAPQTASAIKRGMTYTGHSGLRDFFADVDRVYGRSLQLDAQELHPEGDHVVAVGTVTGERDGERIETEAAWAWKLRDGKVVWGRAYEIPAIALTWSDWSKTLTSPEPAAILRGRIARAQCWLE